MHITQCQLVEVNPKIYRVHCQITKLIWTQISLQGSQQVIAMQPLYSSLCKSAVPANAMLSAAELTSSQQQADAAAAVPPVAVVATVLHEAACQALHCTHVLSHDHNMISQYPKDSKNTESALTDHL